MGLVFFVQDQVATDGVVAFEYGEVEYAEKDDGFEVEVVFSYFELSGIGFAGVVGCAFDEGSL